MLKIFLNVEVDNPPLLSPRQLLRRRCFIELAERDFSSVKPHRCLLMLFSSFACLEVVSRVSCSVAFLWEVPAGPATADPRHSLSSR